MNETFGNLKTLGQSEQHPAYQIDLLCPHCGYYSPAKGIKLGRGYFVVSCYRCKESIMIQINPTIQAKDIPPEHIIDYYPKRKVTVDPFVPQEMANDFLEAQRCFTVAAWQACSVMARRVIHLVVEHFQAQGKDLYQQIEDLRKRQIITPVLADAAQRVRALGKHGAHPYDTKGNPFNDLQMEDARSALEFCEFIFDQVFIQPEKIKVSQQNIR